MRSLILGTAGHIDHGKTALVRALTGVDTDRLAEEKARGITIDLGFAELHGQDIRFGVVDVPGHEGFVRNMLAGATGMDVVVLVVAADEGVMPQTREHHAILHLLGVGEVVVALTKADLVEPEWLELATDDVRDLLKEGPWAAAPVLPVSSTTGAGIPELLDRILEAGRRVDHQDRDDLLALPVDRVFTVRGTGTVVTGTLWSGTLRMGDRVRLLPEGVEARVRGLQVHGQEVEEAGSGQRTAVALTGEKVGAGSLERGQTLVSLPQWEPSSMLTVHLRVLADSSWSLEQGQRVRVHAGTAEVMARCALLEKDRLEPGESGWVQLRLEAPVVARAGQRIVIRSYSPVITFAGGQVAEVDPPKRKRGRGAPTEALEAILAGEGEERVEAALELAGTRGIPEALLPVMTGLPPREVREALPSVAERGAVTSDGNWVGRGVVQELARRLATEVDRVHRDEPFRPGAPIEGLRGLASRPSPRGFADAVVARLVEEEELALEEGSVSRPGFRPTFTPAQQALRERLEGLYREAELAPPRLDDLPEDIRQDPAFLQILRTLEGEGVLVALEPELLVHGPALRAAAARIGKELGGRDGLGPADFKEVLPVTRRHLLPLLRYFDRTAVTAFDGEVRNVPG